VYTVRLITSFERGAALSDPAAGVNVCLIAADGRALLHRVSPVNDPQQALSSMDDICSVRRPHFDVLLLCINIPPA
jgi:hypothetical protein